MPIITNFLAFLRFFPKCFPPGSVPHPHIVCRSGSRRESECGSMRIRIHRPGWRYYLEWFMVWHGWWWGGGGPRPGVGSKIQATIAPGGCMVIIQNTIGLTLPAALLGLVLLLGLY